MTLSEHLKKQELERLNNVWNRLTPLQRKMIALSCACALLPRIGFNALKGHVARRRARFAYQYPAHWMGKVG